MHDIYLIAFKIDLRNVNWNSKFETLKYSLSYGKNTLPYSIFKSK